MISKHNILPLGHPDSELIFWAGFVMIPEGVMAESLWRL